MDKFVKLVEVREIVGHALSTLCDRLKKADEGARFNRRRIEEMHEKVTGQTQ